MHLHFLGICGTFMGSLAQLAIELGHKVTGCDANVYPPMSTQLEQSGITIIDGYDAKQINDSIDLYIVGNAISRGNPLLEAILNQRLPYISGPQWLSEHVLKQQKVLAVSGTHGKTTTTSMLAWILTYAGRKPGYLIGGVAENLPQSATLGSGDVFVIEADEYDSAFNDKRSKFVHYKPYTLVINNVEFDHADIFEDLGAIQKQFHHVVRLLPTNGLLITPSNSDNVQAIIDQGLYCTQQTFGPSGDWQSKAQDGRAFNVCSPEGSRSQIHWDQLGEHNQMNALAAIAAAASVGIDLEISCEALSKFTGVKRRLQTVGRIGRVTVYDDFAHHPTAIEATLSAIRHDVGDHQVIAIIEPRSNTMRMGTHQSVLSRASASADHVVWYKPESLDWDTSELVEADNTSVEATIESVIDYVLSVASQETPSHLVVMSNGSFEDIHHQLLDAFAKQHANPEAAL